MSYQNISVTLVAADKTAIITALQTIKTKLPFLINLTAADRKKLRKMGSVRTSYVQDVYTAANNNASAIPSGFSISEYGKDVTLMKDLTDIFALLQPLFEGVEDTQMALGSELMKQSDECYGYLKVSSKKSSNQNLTMAVKSISDQLKRAKKAVPPSGSANP